MSRPVEHGEFRYSDIAPYPSLKQRKITGQTPPPPPSPLWSPKEYTPRTPKPDRLEKYSPQKYPEDIPPYHVREVDTPPEVIGSPYYYHSTPRTPLGSSPPPEEAGRVRRKEERLKLEEEMKRQNFGSWYLLHSPITNRQDVDSMFEEHLIRFGTPSPPRKIYSPDYHRVETPARSPALELMRQEIKRDTEPNKYRMWYAEHGVKAASRDSVMEKIISVLRPRIDIHDFSKVNVYQAVGMLSEYLKGITEKLISQNVELPPIDENNPAMSFIVQKKISIRRILDEFRDENIKLEFKLRNLKSEIERINEYRFNPSSLEFRAKMRAKLLHLQDMRKRLQRIKQDEGFCIRGCPNKQEINFYKKISEEMEKKWQELRRNSISLKTAVMHAAANTTMFHDYVTASFLEHFAIFLRNMFSRKIPNEVYDAAAQDVTPYLRRIWNKKRHDWLVVNREINELYSLINQKVAETNDIQGEIQLCHRFNKRIKLEYRKKYANTKILEWMIHEARNMIEYRERGYISTRQLLIEQIKMTELMETHLGITPRGPPELGPGATPSPIITSPPSPFGEATGTPLYVPSPGHQFQPETPTAPKGQPEPESFDIPGQQSPLDSLEGSATSLKRSFVIPSPGRRKQLQMDVEIVPQDIRRSPSGERVVCDLAVAMQETPGRRRPSRRIEKRKTIVRGTPPRSETVGRRFDRRYGLFTPQSSFMRDHISARGPLFEGDFESPDSPWGTGRKTHPEHMDMTMHVGTPPSRQLDNTIEWEMSHTLE